MMEKYCPSSKVLSKVCVFVIVFASLLAVMIWDMKKAHSLSEIIHDDHTSRWVQMDEAETKQWLSPLDLCMLKVDEPFIDLKAYKAKNCSKLASNTGALSQKLFCNVGSSLGRQCSPPLSTRSFFTARIRDEYLGNAKSQILSKSLKAIASSQRPVVFIGDGLSKQNQDALICEIMRTDKVTITGSMSGEYSQLQSNFTVHWKEPQLKSLKLDVLYYKMTHVVQDLRKLQRHQRKVKSRARVLSHSLSPTAGTGASFRRAAAGTAADENSTVAISNFTVPHMSSLPFEEVQREVESLVASSPGVVVVANIGVWYNSRERFRQEVPQFLQWLNELGEREDRKNLVFFRETAAQHWNQSDTGYYSFEERESNNGTCSPVADSTPDFDWRNHDVYHILANDGLKHVHTIPFRDITLPLYNMHPSANEYSAAQDCTHFCYFPQMWQSVWYDMHSVALNGSHSRQSRRRRQLRNH